MASAVATSVAEAADAAACGVRRARSRRGLSIVIAVAVLGAGCGGTGGGSSDGVADSSTAVVADVAAQVANLCDSVVALHSAIIDAVNNMSSLEVEADPTDRGVLLADGIDEIIALAEAAEPPSEPASMTAGLDDRRQHVLADLRVEAAAFRADNPTVDQSQRGGAVNHVFLLAEKLMSETEPKVTADTPDDVIQTARDTRSCRFVVQLPPPG